MTVSVITSSIGRKELAQTIESVKAQGFPCRHYIFVNGHKYHDNARKVLSQYSDVHGIYLPEETGDYGTGPSMADVFAAAPFLTKSEWIFFLNDDDFYDPNHMESLFALINRHKLKWAYSLRKFVDVDGQFICHDDWNSLGHWPCVYQDPRNDDAYLVDNSCYVVHRSLATKLAIVWTALPVISDRCFLLALKETKAPYGCTGLSTVNYRVGTGTAGGSRLDYIKCAEITKQNFPKGYPWRAQSVFNSTT